MIAEVYIGKVPNLVFKVDTECINLANGGPRSGTKPTQGSSNRPKS